MATIYRFIVEQKTTGSKESTGRKSNGTKASKKGAGKKGAQTTTLLGSAKGGVEHNRYMRAVNPLLNRMTGGYYEKATRVGRAGLGLVKFNKATGAFAGFSGVAIAIIVSFIIQTVLKIQNQQMAIAERKNERNYKAMENGVGGVRGQYDANVSFWDGRITYNQNK